MIAPPSARRRSRAAASRWRRPCARATGPAPGRRSRRAGRRASAGETPSTVMRPPDACSRSAMTRSSVVLPQPYDGPMKETNSPSRTWRFAFASAFTRPSAVSKVRSSASASMTTRPSARVEIGAVRPRRGCRQHRRPSSALLSPARHSKAPALPARGFDQTDKSSSRGRVVFVQLQSYSVQSRALARAEKSFAQKGFTAARCPRRRVRFREARRCRSGLTSWSEGEFGACPDAALPALEVMVFRRV